MKPDHILDEKSGHVSCQHRFGSRDEDFQLRQPVHDDQDRIMVIAGRQVRDPVERNAALGFRGNRQRVQEPEGRVAHHLVPPARVTAAHVALDSCSKPCPLEVLPHEGLCPRHAVVSRQGRVMVQAENVEDEGC